MAFGLFGSIIPEINKNTTLYSSPSDTLVVGKVSISSKNYSPAKIRLGITTDNINIEYLEYNRFINYGETFETDTIYFGNEQSLIVRSTHSDVNFLVYGETIVDELNPVKSGLLGSVTSTDNTKKEIFVSPTSANSIVNLSVCNLNSLPAKARIGITSETVYPLNPSQYIEYDVEIGPNQTYTRNDLKLDSSQSIIVSSSEDSDISFVCHGRVIYGEVASDNLTINGNLRVDGNTGLGTFFARSKLDVEGSVRISRNLNVSGIITGIVTTTSLNQSLLNLGALPSLDGSALTGIIAASEGGVQINNQGVSVGIATIINFQNNVRSSFGSGIATVTTSDSIVVNEDLDVTNNFRVATNKFVVNGSSGNVTILGTLSINSTLSANGFNALNNRVINVGAATSGTDAANKRYVDSKSIAMAIALS